MGLTKSIKPYIDAQIATVVGGGSPKGVYTTLATLQTAFPTGATGVYLVTADGKWYYWNGSAWTAGGVYQATGLGVNTVTASNLTFVPVVGVKSKNLYNKNTSTSGSYVIYNTGGLQASAGYYYSDYIPVLPSVAYVKRYAGQMAFYNSAKVFITGIIGGAASTAFTTPVNCYYIRITLNDTSVAVEQVEQGIAITDYETYDNKVLIDSISNAVEDTINTDAITKVHAEYKSNLKMLSEDLNNPFIKTQIKLNGDSITAGFGGTGFSATGDLIPGTVNYMNVLTATCWANMLHKLVDTKFNKQFVVDMRNKHITYTAPPYSLGGGISTAICNSYVRMNNTNVGLGLEFDVYGTYCDIFYTASAVYGILDIYVDDVKVDTLDTYATPTAWQSVKHLTLGIGKHRVKLLETNTKNASSGGYQVQIEAIRVTKIAQVINYGISGVTSQLAGAPNLISSDDDYVFIMLGVNDRSEDPDASYLKMRLVGAVDKIKAINADAEIIFMSNPPVSLAQENNLKPSGTYYFGMFDVDMAVGDAAAQSDLSYISNYDHFLRYAKYTGVTVDSLLSDGLHPNDAGYVVIFENICRCIGLPVLRDGLSL